MSKIKGQYILKDFQDAMKLHRKPGKAKLVWLVFIFSIMLIGIIGVINLVIDGKVSYTIIIFPLIGILSFVFAYFILLPFSIKRQFNQRTDITAPFEIELTDLDFSFSNRYGYGRTPWNEFIKWKENSDMILLYKGDNAYNMLPKRIIDGKDIQFINDKLSQSNVQEFSKAPNPVRKYAWIFGIITALFILLIEQFIK